MPDRPPLTTTEYAVLGLLADGEQSGYDLARSAQRSIEYMWAPSRSQIYKVLPRLVSFGLATSRAVEQRSRPDKELYRITRSGRAALKKWVEQVDEDPRADIGRFLLKLYFGWIGDPAATLAQLDAYRARTEANLDAFRAIDEGIASDAPVHWRMAVRHGIARAQATVEWAEASRRALERQRLAARRR